MKVKVLIFIAVLAVFDAFGSKEYNSPELNSKKIDENLIKESLKKSSNMYLIHRRNMVELGLTESEFANYIKVIKELNEKLQNTNKGAYPK